MANIVYRSATLPGPNAASVNKGSPLLNTEIDGNFRGINDDLAAKAPLASPALTGSPTAPTAVAGTNNTQIATTAFVNAERSNTATLTNKTLTDPLISNVYGSSAASGNLNLISTTNATKGEVRLGGSGDTVKLNTTTAGFVKTNATGVFSVDTNAYYFATGTDVAVADGGTGLSTAPSNGQLLIGNGTGYTLGTLTQGTGITVTNAAGTITVTNNDRGSSQNIFKNMTDGTNTAVADGNDDTFTFAQNGALTVVVDPATDKVTYSHADTSTQASVDNSGNTFIQDITLDTYGHITAIVSGTATQSNDFGTVAIGTDSGYTWGVANTNTNQVADTTGDTLTLVKGGGIDLFTSTVAGTDAIKIEHADTSTVANLSSDNSGGTYIQDISFTFDTYGHVTAATVATGTESNDFGTFAINGTDSGYTWGTANTNTNQAADSRGDTLTFVKGGGLNFYTNTVAGTDAIKIEHADTSTQASVNNSGNTFIQDITLDDYGHITGIVSATVAEADTLQLITDRGATTTNAVTITNTSSNALDVSGGVVVGGTLSANTITGKLQSYTETLTVATITATTHNINTNLSNIFDLTLSNNVTFTFTNPPPAGVSKSITIILRQDSTGNRTATFTGALYTDGVAPILSTGANAIDVLTFFTVNGGSSWFGTFAMANVS